MTGNDHRPKKEYSDEEVEQMVLEEIHQNYNLDEDGSLQGGSTQTTGDDNCSDLEYDTEDLEDESEESVATGDEEHVFNKKMEPDLCKDSVLGFEKNNTTRRSEGHSSDPEKQESITGMVRYGTIYEIKPKIKYTIVGGMIYLYFNPLIYSPAKDDIESALTILSLKNHCLGHNTERFYTGEITIYYNPTVQTTDSVMVCVKLIAGLIEARKLNVSK